MISRIKFDIYCDCTYVSNEKLKRHVPTDVLLSFAAGQLEGHVTVDGMLQVEDRAVLDHYNSWSGESDKITIWCMIKLLLLAFFHFKQQICY